MKLEIKNTNKRIMEEFKRKIVAVFLEQYEKLRNIEGLKAKIWNTALIRFEEIYQPEETNLHFLFQMTNMKYVDNEALYR